MEDKIRYTRVLCHLLKSSSILLHQYAKAKTSLRGWWCIIILRRREFLIPYPSSKSTYTPWKSLVDVSFDFFDPNPKIDYHAIKRLLTQLLQRDAEELHVNELAELILSQPTVGTTIKTDGIDSDPFALFTVLNMHLHHVRFNFSQFPFYAENINVNTTAKSLDKGHR